MIPTNKTVEIYYLVDEFLKEYDAVIKSHSLEKGAPKKRRNRKFTMSGSEVMTILILFHFSSFRDLKHFYLFVRSRMKFDFPHTVSYNRFVELERKVCIPLAVFLKMKALGQCTGISFIDSTPIRSCHIKREKQHKTFKEFARKGKSTLGWFYGFKLHLIINDKGELLDFLLTPGNVDDRAPLKHMDFHKRIFGKLFGDRGYISKDLFEQLFIDGVHLVTRLKKGMKNALMLQHEKIMLRKRSLIETVNDQLNNICQIEHTRHRCFPNFIINLLSALAAFSFFDKKPSINTAEEFIHPSFLTVA